MKWIVTGILALSFFSSLAHAFIANETEKGIIELRSALDRGLVITELASRTIRRNHWIYFCVSELAPRLTPASRSRRCFYGRMEQFRNVELNKVFYGIEYNLRHRILNESGTIPIGMGRPFYAVTVLR